MNLTYKKTDFINLINRKFTECSTTGRRLEPSIKGFLKVYLPTLTSIEAMKDAVSGYFSDPSAFDTGSVCSALFMDAIESFQTDTEL